METSAAVTLGTLPHLLIFIHGKWNSYASSILATFSVAFSLPAFLASIHQGSLFQGITSATVLSTWYLVSLSASIIIYHLLFHRARRFPGPCLDAITKWRGAARARATGQYHLELARLHEGYGDFVRTGKWVIWLWRAPLMFTGSMELSVNNADAMRAVYGFQSICGKGPWYDLGGTGNNLHRTRNWELHNRQKGFWERGFTAEGIIYGTVLGYRLTGIQ